MSKKASRLKLVGHNRINTKDTILDPEFESKNFNLNYISSKIRAEKTPSRDRGSL